MITQRYERQVRLAGFGEAAQRRLRAATVLVVGAGGLGAPVLTYLAGAGVGRLRIVDDDVVEATNLPRQVLYGEADIGQTKVALAAARVRALTTEVTVEPITVRLTADNVGALLDGVTAVVDCSDTLATRRVVNRACLAAGVPVVWAAVGGWSGRCSVTWPGDKGGDKGTVLLSPPGDKRTVPLSPLAPGAGPCFECLAPPPETLGPTGGPARTSPAGPSHPVTADEPSAAPVFGPVCGAVGALAAGEAIKLLSGAGDLLIGRLASLDARTGDLRTIPLRRDPACPACAGRDGG